MSTIRSSMAPLAGLFLAAVLVLPAIGPLAEHHFAERQPGHMHLVHAGAHHHSYEQLHSHGGRDSSGANGPAIAVCSHESGPPSTVAALSADSSMQSFFAFEPTSLFDLPPLPEADPSDTLVLAPRKPPQDLI